MKFFSYPEIIQPDFFWFESETHPASALLVTAIIFLISLIAVLLTYMLFLLFAKNRQSILKTKWLNRINEVIQDAIFHEVEGQQMEVDGEMAKLLRIKSFRLLFIAELVKAKRSFSGMAGSNLEVLYRQCQLDKDSLRKLRSRYWHLKAQGVQELAIMNQKEAFDKIYYLTNDTNEQVRIEAQTAVVLFSGFAGLAFLDFLTFPISQWQQIKLLTDLGNKSTPLSSKLSFWLDSGNTSVTNFSLKLVAKYQLYELHEKVVTVLSHEEPEVRLQAILTLKEIYNDQTSSELQIQYHHEDLPNKLAILRVMCAIGTAEDIPFLMEQFRQHNNQIKLEAGRAIAELSQNVGVLENQPVTAEYPWSLIVQQIKGERAA